MGILKKFLGQSNANINTIDIINSLSSNDASKLNLNVDTDTVSIDSNKSGSGTVLPLTLKTDGAERLRIDTSGNVIINTSTISTSATSGFLWIPSCNGIPNGSPNSPYTNATALVFDTTNRNLVLRSGSNWITTAKLTGEGSIVGWNDITSDINVRGTGSNDPTWSLFRNNIYGYSFGTNTMNQAWITFHIKHDYAVGTPIHLHTHWSTTGTDTGVCRWGFEYTIAKGHQQSQFGTTNSYYVEQQSLGVPYTHMVAETAGILSDELEPDSLVLVRVFRDASHANDTLSDAAFLFTADIHYQCDRMSTKNRIPNFYS